MQETGVRNGAFGADKFGLKNLKGVHWNFGAPQLYQYSLAAGEAVLSADGALCADTGEFTGRSPKDKFTVRDATTDKNMWWAGNQSITSEQFEALYADFLKHAEGKTLFAQDLYGGADPTFQIKTRVFTELAWHSLFIRTLLIRPEASELASFVPELTIIDLPSFRADPKRHGVRSENVVAIDFARKIVLIGGSYYAGEMKKSVFTTLNYYLPEKGVMPMHCSANVGPDGDTAIFFGLSGTGKTTLSADPKRTLIGDDEHGWGKDGIFNFEGGCYAKCIKLSQEAEPEIYAASKRFGAVLENVRARREHPRARFRRRLEDRKHPFGLSARLHPQRLAHRPRRPSEERGDAGRRRLRRDAADRQADAGAGDVSFPVRLHREGRRHRARPRQRAAAGILHLLRLAVPAARSLASTAIMLRDLIAKHNVDCWLVNTGWTGGKYGTGRRMPIKVTRALLTAALDGSLRNADFRTDKYFGFAVPTSLPGVEPHILDPDQDLGRQGRVRQDRACAGRHVPEELCQVRSPGRRRSPRRRAGSEARGGVGHRRSKFEKGGSHEPPFLFRNMSVAPAANTPGLDGRTASSPRTGSTASRKHHASWLLIPAQAGTTASLAHQSGSTALLGVCRSVICRPNRLPISSTATRAVRPRSSRNGLSSTMSTERTSPKSCSSSMIRWASR